MSTLLAIIALVLLPPPFGEAEAGAVSLDGGLTIEVTVEADGPFTVVLAQPFSSFEQLPPTALADLGDGRWGGFVELPSAENWNLVFDAFESDGTTVRSESANLIELGVDRVVVSGEPTEPSTAQRFSAGSIWLAVALVLLFASLGALAWWTFSKPDGADPDSGVSPESADG